MRKIAILSFTNTCMFVRGILPSYTILNVLTLQSVTLWIQDKSVYTENTSPSQTVPKVDLLHQFHQSWKDNLGHEIFCGSMEFCIFRRFLVITRIPYGHEIISEVLKKHCFSNISFAFQMGSF